METCVHTEATYIHAGLFITAGPGNAQTCASGMGNVIVHTGDCAQLREGTSSWCGRTDEPTACSPDPPEPVCEIPEQAELAWRHTLLVTGVWNCLAAAVSKPHLDLRLDVGSTSPALRFGHPPDGKEVCWLG